MKRTLLFALVAAACGAPAPTAPATPMPTPTPSPTPVVAVLPLPAPRTALEPGRYFSSVGSLGIQFTVGSGWTYEQQALDFFDIERDPGSPDVIAVQFAGLALGPNNIQPVIDSVTQRDHLSVSAPQPVALDCHLDATLLTVQTMDPPDSDPPIFRPVIDIAAGPLSIASGRRLQLEIFNFHMGGAVIMIGGSIAHWDQALAAAQPVLDSIQLRPSGGAACN